MRMLLILILALAPGVAAAECVDSTPNAPGILVDARAAMLIGDYEAFTRIADAAGRIPSTQKLNIVNVLTGAHPNGFNFCEVLLRRHLSDKLYQELTIFSEAGKEWLFLYALGATINGRDTLLNYKFSNSAAEELAKFR